MNLFLFVFLAAVLSACARAPVEDTIKPAWEIRKDELTGVRSWDIRARIAVRTDSDSGSASLHWTQRKDVYQMRVIAPLGSAYELSGGSDGAQLRTSKNHVLRAEDAETLLQRHAGWWLPVSRLAYWIRGIPVPALQVDTLLLDEKNRLSALNQSGWSIQYKSYVEVDGQSMPGRLDLRNERIRIRMSIKEWDLH